MQAYKKYIMKITDTIEPQSQNQLKVVSVELP